MADNLPGATTADSGIVVGKLNRRRKSYRDLYAELSRDVQEHADQKFEFFVANPRHPSLRLHRLRDAGKGSHEPNSYSVTVERRYRALYFIDGDTNVWYWIGTHTDYDRFTGG